jgi:hypothetical protein
METKRLSEPTGPVHITRERIRGFTPGSPHSAVPIFVPMLLQNRS